MHPSAGDWAVVDLRKWQKDLQALRDLAMQTKDFSRLDALKSALTAAGVEVRMSKIGVELRAGAGFDPDKLVGI
jgi:cysteinyl-tRNA synthetase